MLLDETVSPPRVFQRLITRCEKKYFPTSFWHPWFTQFGQVTTYAFIITIQSKQRLKVNSCKPFVRISCVHSVVVIAFGVTHYSAIFLQRKDLPTSSTLKFILKSKRDDLKTRIKVTGALCHELLTRQILLMTDIDHIKVSS